MKILTVFYSLTGNTKKIALSIAAAAGGDIEEIKLTKRLPANKFLKYFAAGRQLMKKELPQIQPFEKNPAEYDMVFIGTPVWGSNFVPAVGSYLKFAKLENKKVALFCAHGGDDPGTALDNLQASIPQSRVVGKIGFKMDEMPPDIVEKKLRQAGEWAKGMAQK